MKKLWLSLVCLLVVAVFARMLSSASAAPPAPPSGCPSMGGVHAVDVAQELSKAHCDALVFTSATWKLEGFPSFDECIAAYAKRLLAARGTDAAACMLDEITLGGALSCTAEAIAKRARYLYDFADYFIRDIDVEIVASAVTCAAVL